MGLWLGDCLIHSGLVIVIHSWHPVRHLLLVCFTQEHLVWRARLGLRHVDDQSAVGELLRLLLLVELLLLLLLMLLMLLLLHWHG